jgi:ribosomal protein L37AE/L43A
VLIQVTGEFSMTLRVTVPTSYIHERYLGRPSCPKCGELLMAPECSECLDWNDVRHVWMCDKCDYGFETLIRFNVLKCERALARSFVNSLAADC